MDGVARLGCKWRDIAKLLNNSSDSPVRNRWQRLQRSSTPPAEIEFVPQAGLPPPPPRPVKPSAEP